MNVKDDALTAGLPLVEELKKLYKQMMSDQAEGRQQQEKDMRFVAGDQWNSIVKNTREQEARPTYTINRIPQFVQNITNDMRQNRPAIEVAPIGDGADVDTAEVISGLIRHIEQDSNAASAYDNAAFYQTSMGEGYFRITSRFVDENSFEQELKIKPIANPFTVLYDTNSIEPDGSDADVCIIARDISPYEYKNKYGSTKLADSMSSAEWLKDLGDGDWISAHTIRVAEYWKRIYDKTTIYLIEHVDVMTGEVVAKETTEDKPDDKVLLAEFEAATAAALNMSIEPTVTPEGVNIPTTYRRIAADRPTYKVRVKQYLCNGHEVIDETDWPGRFIPVIPVRGHEIYVGGKRHRYGVVRATRDPQQIYNIMASAQAETIAMSTKAPWLVSAGQVKGFEEMWEQANVKNLAFLPYNPEALNGAPVPPPTRMTFEPAIQAIAATRAIAAEDLKAVTGVYDAALGARQGEESGKAILARQAQTATANFHFHDNLKRAVKHAGRILVDIIPHFYSEPRMVRIVKPTGEQQVIAINNYANDQPLGDLGGEKVHDLTVGKYDVAVTTGKSYTTKRQEGVESMMELSRIVPQATELFMDLMVKDMDWPGAQSISKRLKAALAMTRPDLLRATGEDQNDENKIDAEIRAATLEKQVQSMQEGLEQAIKIGEELRTENTQLRSRTDVDLAKLELEREIKAIELQMKMHELALKEQEAIAESIKTGMNYKLEKERLRAARDNTAVNAARAAAEVADKVMDRVPTPVPEIEIEGKENDEEGEEK